MKRLVVCAFVVCLLAAVSAAQPHPGGIMVGAGYPGSSLSYLNGLYLASKDGKLTTVVDTFGVTRPYWFDDVQMGIDNKEVVFACRGSTSSLYSLKYGLYSYDRASGKFATIAMHVKDFRAVYGFTSDQDGDWLVSSQCYDANNRTTYGIFKVSNSGGWTTLLTTAAIGYRQYWPYAVRRDIDTGDLLIPSSYSHGFFNRPVYSLSPHGKLTSWNTSSNGPAPTYGWSQEISTGDMVYSGGNYLYRCPKGRLPQTYIRMTGLLPSGVATYCLVYENQSAPTPRVIVYGVRQASNATDASLFWLDPATAKVTKTVPIIKSSSKVMVPYWQSIVGQEGGRNIQLVKTGQGTWSMNFSFPTYPNKRYVVAANLTGVRPGLMLPDGRHIWINFDDLVPLTVDNKISVVFNPGPGQLNSSGAAKGWINMSWLQNPLNVTAHIIAAVLDPKAPYGIGFITEPYPFQF